MKKLTTLMFALTLSVIGFGQINSNGNCNVVIAKAKSAVQAECLAGNGQLGSAVWTKPDGPYTTYNVFFFKEIGCPGNQICPLYLRILPLAKVTVDIDFNVVAYSCGFSIYDLQGY